MLVGVSPVLPSIKDSKLSEVITLVGVSIEMPSMLLTMFDLTVPKFRVAGRPNFPSEDVVAVVLSTWFSLFSFWSK